MKIMKMSVFYPWVHDKRLETNFFDNDVLYFLTIFGVCHKNSSTGEK